jgi:molybdopterin-guanine dinucleotide biosynthesis protein A
MGRDKGTISVHGKSQREYLSGELNIVCARTFISAKQPLTGYDSIIDSFSIDGPLNGILSALTYDPTRAWLVVAVDMPYVDRQILQHLVSVRDPGKLATCFYNNDTSLPEPLLTIWEPAAFEPLRKFVEAGGISPREFLSTNNTCVVTPPDPKVFYNMNRPEDII